MRLCTCSLEQEEDSDLYADLQELKDQREELVNRIMEHELHGDVSIAQRMRQDLKQTEECIIQRNHERQHRK